MVRPPRLVYLVAVMALGTAAMILSSCTNPVSSPPMATVSGKVYDQSTGAPLSGATVAIGSTSTTTNSSGDYTLTVPSNGSSVTGNLAVSDGTGASSDGFIYVAGATIPISNGSATLNVPLPTNSNADTPYSLTINVANSGGTTLSGGNVAATIVNQNGGIQFLSGPNGNNFSGVVTPCSSCTVAGSYVPSSGSPWGFYETNVSITPTGTSGSQTATLTIKQPSTSSTTLVTVTNASTASGASVGAALEMPGVGAVPVALATPTSGSATLAVYNPNSYQVVFGQSVPGPAAAAYSFAAAFSSAGAVPSGNTVSLPSLTVSIPTSSPDVTSASYLGGTLTFTPSTDAAGTMLLIENPGPVGLVWTTGASVTLPTSIQNLIAAFSGWQTKAFGVNASGVSGVAELDSIYEGLLSNAAPVPGAQLADYSVSPQYKSTTVP